MAKTGHRDPAAVSIWSHPVNVYTGVVVVRSSRLRFVAALLIAFALFAPSAATAHSGALDSNGGHHCRTAGYESGSCGPLNSYHCHEAGCTDHDGATGWGGPAGGGTAEPDPDPQPDPVWDTYRPAPSGVTGTKMGARRMLGQIQQAAERGGYWYYRDEFPHWADRNGDGCDTRQAVLISESQIRVDREPNCDVNGGMWFSVYDGVSWYHPSDVDVDHVVALKEAWVSGARNWGRAKRRDFANDLEFRPSLRAVTDNVNQSKGDRDPAEWLPTRARCSYAINWVQVKYRWRLKANGAELDALRGIIRGKCGDRRVNVPKRMG